MALSCVLAARWEGGAFSWRPERAGPSARPDLSPVSDARVTVTQPGRLAYCGGGLTPRQCDADGATGDGRAIHINDSFPFVIGMAPRAIGASA
jgi:hypothetical protein